VEFRVLGPLQVLEDGRAVAVGGVREQALLAALALSPGEAMSTDRLVDALWGDRPPRSATKQLQNHVLRLRKALGPAVIRTTPLGYALGERVTVDTARFESGLRAARATAAREGPAESLPIFAAALAEWRGRPFEELGGWAPADAETARLDELWRRGQEEAMDARIACGADAECVADLEAMVSAEPLREHRWAQLMMALYRSGRQADALRAYQRARETLAQELGIEPGPELQATERAVLAQDPDLAWQPSRLAGPPATATLPSGVVTFLLSDIVGSTSLWERDSKTMAEAVARHDTLIHDAVDAHGGTVLKARGEGDSTFSVFTRATDALTAALSAQRALVGEAWPASTPLSVRMALHTGEAFERDGDYYGPTVNRAARIRSLAAGGQVLVSRSTGELVQDDLPDQSTLVELGSHVLSGLTRAQRILGLAAPGLPDLPAPFAEAPESPTGASLPLPGILRTAAGGFFVGRGADLESLITAWKHATDGSPRIVMVAGEPGVGKTRLAAELARRVDDEGGTVLYGRCDEDLGVPYQPFAEALRPYVATCPLDELARHVEAHEGELSRLVPELPRRLPRTAPPLQAEPEVERYRLFEAVSGLLTDASLRLPVLLVLDDLHWAAKPTLLLLRHLVAHLESSAVLIVGMYRDTELGRTHALAETLADLRRLEGVERLALGGLDAAGVTAFVEATAGQTLEEPGRALARAVHAETDGNPFFVGQVLRHLAETGVIHRRDGQWAYDASLDQLGIPEGVREVIGRRLSRLTETTDRLLQVASVVGRDFDLDVLGRVSGVPEDDVLASMEEATTARVITEVADVLDRYSFVHALVRETLYDEVPTSRRVRVHRRVGEVLEELRSADLGPYFAQLAHHFGEAAEGGGVAKAIGYARHAAERAMGVLAYEEAASQTERALQLVELEDSPDEATRAELLVALGEALYGAGESVRAREAFAEAAASASRHGRSELLARAALGYNDATFLAVGYADELAVDAAAQLLREALDALGDGETALHVLLLARIPRTLHINATVAERLPSASRALAIAEQLGDRVLLAGALEALYWARIGPDYVEENLETEHQLVALARELGDRPREYWAHIYLGNSLLELGDITGVDQEIEVLEQLGGELRSPQYRYFPVLRRAMRAILEGRLDDGERLAFEAFEIGQEKLPEPALGMLGAQLLNVRRHQGRLGELEGALRAQVDRYPVLPVLRCALCDLLCAEGRAPEAQQEFERVAAHDFADLPGFYLLVCLSQLTEACVFLGDERRAPRLYDLLAPYAHHNVVANPSVVAVGSAARSLGQLAATMRRWEAAEAHFEAALAFNTGMGARPATASTQVAYARMLLARSAPGDADRAARLLARASTMSETLGLAGITAEAEALR
jgi:DNA-binding SARP family transcriptional activator/tetratricopeptide (TPR) repeat protein